MGEFVYTVVDANGERVNGTMNADTMADVRNTLENDGKVVVSVKPQSFWKKDLSIGGGKVKTRDLSVFCRQFASILSAGVSVVEALKMMVDQTTSVGLKNAINKTSRQVQQGDSLAAAMKKSPKVFPEMLVNMVHAGEQSGSLERSVEKMGIQFEKSAKLAGLVKKAMIYPIVLLTVTIGVAIAMSVFVVPKFVSMFEDMGTELPGITKAVMAFSDFCIEKWYVLIIIAVSTIVFISIFKRTMAGKVFFGKLALKLPVFGLLNKKSYSAKFARTLSTLLSSGMDITAAVDISAEALSNEIYKRTVHNAKTEIEQGMPLSAPLRKSKQFPALVYNMLAIGEETGNIPGMLEKVAEYFEEETEITTASLSEMIQPLVIIIMGGMVAVLVLAMYMPMVTMYGNMG